MNTQSGSAKTNYLNSLMGSLRCVKWIVAMAGFMLLAVVAEAATVATPSFSSPAGTYSNAQTIAISTTTSGATIRYTVDGSTPSTTSGAVYSGPVSITATTTLKAIAYKSGSTNSAVKSVTYTLKAAAPTFSPSAGTYTGAQSIAISTTTSAATIRYTNNGSTPSATSGTVYIAGTPVTISGTTTLKAIAYKTGYTNSTVTSGIFTINPAIAPSITTQPTSRTVALSQSTIFTTVASGTAPLAYQWKKGGASISGATDASYTIASVTVSDAASYTVTVTNSAGSVTSSAAVLTVNNQAPSVTLTAPVTNTTLTLPTTVTFTATASDLDGSISKVEFFNNGTLLGSTMIAPFSLSWTPTKPGLALLTAVATDNLGATATSAAVSVTLLPGLPYAADFESTEGYALGSLNNQLGWSVTAGSAQIVSGTASHGTQFVTFNPGTNAAVVDQEFGSPASNPAIAFVDFYAKPVAGTDTSSGTLFDVDAARLACVLNGGSGQLYAFDGDGAGAGTWHAVMPVYSLAAGGVAVDWQRITVRLNYTAGMYDLYLNGVMVAADLKFRLAVTPYVSWFSVKGHTTGSATLDDLYAGSTNPLFTDTNNDGLPDDLTRTGDYDHDGLSDLQELLLGTSPRNADTDGDSITDGWEVKNGLNPLSAGDASRMFNGITALQAFRTGRILANGGQIPAGANLVIRTAPATYYGISPSNWSIQPVAAP